MVTGNILKESYRWQFTDSMLDCTLNCLIEVGCRVCVWEGGVLEQMGEFEKSSKLNKQRWGLEMRSIIDNRLASLY